jgi:cell division protein YceG involved in septum cleavage
MPYISMLQALKDAGANGSVNGIPEGTRLTAFMHQQDQKDVTSNKFSNIRIYSIELLKKGGS